MNWLLPRKLIFNKKNKVLLSLLVLVPLYLLILNFVVLPDRLVFRHRAQEAPEIANPATMPFLVDDCHSPLIKFSESVCPVVPPAVPQTAGAQGGGVSYQVPTAPFQLGVTASLANGSATVSYPIALPPGANGFTPSLSLSYSSGAVEDTASRNHDWPNQFDHQTASWVGLGWNLNGLPKIVKTNVNEQEPDRVNPNYTLILNNESYKLVLASPLIQAPSDPNAPGRCETVEWRTEPESFIRIRHSYSVSYGSNDNRGAFFDECGFTVIDKSGTRYSFAPALYHIYRVPAESGGLADHNAAVYHTWYATRIEDRLGNIIQINYPGLDPNNPLPYAGFFGWNQVCRGNDTPPERKQRACPANSEKYCQSKGIEGFENQSGGNGMASRCPNEVITALLPISLQYGRKKAGNLLEVIGEVTFDLSPREDYSPGKNQVNPGQDHLLWDDPHMQVSFSKFKLDKIKVYSYLGSQKTLLRSYQLNHSYTDPSLGSYYSHDTPPHEHQCRQVNENGGEGGPFGCKHLLLTSLRLGDGSSEQTPTSFPYFEQYSYHAKDNHFLLSSAESKKNNSSAFTKKMEVTYSSLQACATYYDGSAGGCPARLTTTPQIKFLSSLKTTYLDPLTGRRKYQQTDYQTDNDLSGVQPGTLFNALCRAGSEGLSGYEFLGLQTAKVKNYKEKEEGQTVTDNDILSSSQTWFEQGDLVNDYCGSPGGQNVLKVPPYHGSVKKAIVYDYSGKELSKTVNQTVAKEFCLRGSPADCTNPANLVHHTFLSQSFSQASDPDTNLSRCSLTYNGSAVDDYSRYYDVFGNQLMSVAFGEITCPTQVQENDPSSWKSLDNEAGDNRLSQTVTYPSVNTNISPLTLNDNQYYLASQVKSSLSKIKNSQNQWEVLSQTDFSYQQNGLLERTTAMGDSSTGSPVTAIGYDNFNNLNLVIDPLQRSITTTYDSSLHLLPKTVINPKRFTSSTTYDFELSNAKTKFGLPVISTDINDLSTFTVYDSFGRPICTYNALDYRDSLKNLVFSNQQDCQNTSPKATAIIYYDDNLNSPLINSGVYATKTSTKVINGRNEEIYLTTLSLVDPLGRTIQTQTEIDSEVSVKDDGSPLPSVPAGQKIVLVSQAKYNQFGAEESLRPFYALIDFNSPRLVSEVDFNVLNSIPAGKTTNVYNNRGELVKVVFPDGRRTIALSTIGKSLTVDADNHASLTETNIWGQTVSSKSFNNKVTEVDPTDSRLKANLFNTLANAPGCNFTPESNGTVLASSDQDKFCLHNESKTIYDRAGRVKYAADGAVSDQVDQFEPIYQDSCQQAKTNPSFVYQPDTKLKAHVSFACYDKLSRPSFSYVPDSGQSSGYVYDLAGNLLSVKDARGNIISNEYDVLNRLFKVKENGQLRKTFVYDQAPGKTDIGGLGKLRVEANSGGTSLPLLTKEYDYNEKGLLSETKESVKEGGVPLQENLLALHYDNFGRLSETVLNNQETIRPVYNETYGTLISTVLSAAGQTPLTLYANLKSNRFGGLMEYTLGNNTKEKFSYKLEEKKLLLGKHEVLSPTGTSLFTATYKNYDNLGNLKELSLSSPENNFGTKNWFYGYDHFSRLTKMERMTNDSKPFTYSYDRLGNLLAKNEKQVTVNMSYPDTLNTYGQDKPIHAPVLVDSREYIYDSTGNLIAGDNLSSITYDAFNKAISMTVAGASAQNFEYAYDTGGQRFFQKNPDDSYVLYFSNEERHFNAGKELIKKVQRFLGPNGVLLEREINPSASPPVITLKFIHADNLSSTSLMTGANGERLDGPATYTPYGQSILDLSQTSYKFTGGKKDEETGLYLFGARYYNPKTGRFISPDPLGGGYAYAADNPIKFNDPTGFDVNGPGPAACPGCKVDDYLPRGGDYPWEMPEDPYYSNNSSVNLPLILKREERSLPNPYLLAEENFDKFMRDLRVPFFLRKILKMTIYGGTWTRAFIKTNALVTVLDPSTPKSVKAAAGVAWEKWTEEDILSAGMFAGTVKNVSGVPLYSGGETITIYKGLRKSEVDRGKGICPACEVYADSFVSWEERYKEMVKEGMSRETIALRHAVLMRKDSPGRSWSTDIDVALGYAAGELDERGGVIQQGILVKATIAKSRGVALYELPSIKLLNPEWSQIKEFVVFGSVRPEEIGVIRVYP